MARRPKPPMNIDAYDHEATRPNNPTAELAPIAERMEEAAPAKPVAYPRAYPLEEGEHRERDEDLDPQIIWDGTKITLTDAQIEQLKQTGTVEIGHAQLTWRGKDRQDWSDLVVNVPPIYVQEHVHPQAIVEDLKRSTARRKDADAVESGEQPVDLFAQDFDELDPEAMTEFYAHDVDWTNRLILGDSLQVMASLAERERLRGKVQCIYFDPPYGIKFNSNWQVSTRSRDVKDGKLDSVTREPEQVKAFRDTWKDGIHSYLTYLRDRLTVARDLLTESGSIFVQIGDENVHRVRALMDEVFGEENFVSLIVVWKTSSQTSAQLPTTCDFIVWYAKNASSIKYRQMYTAKDVDDPSSGAGEHKNFWNQFGDYFTNSKAEGEQRNLPRFRPSPTTSQSGSSTTRFDFPYAGKIYKPGPGGYKSNREGFDWLSKADRMMARKTSVSYVRFLMDFPVVPIAELWTDVRWGFDASDKRYVVETNPRVVQRCILMTTDPGDLVLDPTCGSGTTATVSEQWGRRWITIDTSRVALALARTRIMSARYPYYHLKDTPEGRVAEMKLTGTTLPDVPTEGDIRQGFVYERAPHITLKSIANNPEIDIIWERYEEKLAPLREAMTGQLPDGWLDAYRAEQNYDVEVGPEIEEWEVPREAPDGFPTKLHEKFWDLRIARQKEIDTSIAQAADVELLYDRPVEDKTKVRVVGPFTVESLSPHRITALSDQDDAILEALPPGERLRRESTLSENADFTGVILENLKAAGVQQSNRDERIDFTDISPYPGKELHAIGVFVEEETGEQRRVGIQVGPEYGSLRRSDIAAAAREAAEAGFDMLLSCAFAFDAHASELNKLGPLQILRAKMNPDLHMADDLKKDSKGNLFLVIGEPDIRLHEEDDGETLRVELLGMDVFVPATGEVRSNELKDIAAWFIDTDYDEEAFFVRHAYFLGGGSNDPYKSLKTALKAEIDREAWSTLYKSESRPFPRPKTGRIAVRVINHFGDEVMRVMGVMGV